MIKLNIDKIKTMSVYEVPGGKAGESERKIEDQSNESKEENLERRRKRIVILAKELSEKQEGFPFPGIDPDIYGKLKISAKEYPEYATDPDRMIEKFKENGIKIMFGDDPESGNVFVLPLGSNDIENDGMLLQNLQVNEFMKNNLKELILIKKAGCSDYK
jgi:hypothetical protein